MLYILKQRKQLTLNNRQVVRHKILIIRNYLDNIPAFVDNEIGLHLRIHLCDNVHLLLYAHDDYLDDHCYHLFSLFHDVRGVHPHDAKDNVEVARVYTVLGLCQEKIKNVFYVCCDNISDFLFHD
jgi:hypothetical protein